MSDNALREIEDQIEDYLIDCCLNSWEPDSGKIANLVVSIPALMLLRSKTALDVVAEKMEAVARAEAAEAERDKANADWHRMRDLHAAAITDLRTAEAEVARLREDTRLVQQWFLSKPWEGEPDARDFGGGPYSPDERAIGYGTYCDPRMLPPMLARAALAPKEDA